jgi:FkbM family methyltransferase
MSASPTAWPTTPTLDGALARCVARATPVRTIIDIGASNAQWSRIAARHYPAARFHLLEAKTLHKPGLDAFVKENPRASYELAAVSDSVGTTWFYPSDDPWGGHVSGERVEGAVEMTMTSVDAEVEKHALEAPFFLKFDTHGHESQILAGAARTLERTSLIVMEVYNFRHEPFFAERTLQLADLGFRCVDLCDPMYRSRDGALWQMDLVYAREDDPVFDSSDFA